jgi:hypothetical protein
MLELAHNPYFDPALGVAPLTRRRRDLKFVQEGTFIKRAERVRAQVRDPL